VVEVGESRHREGFGPNWDFSSLPPPLFFFSTRGRVLADDYPPARKYSQELESATNTLFFFSLDGRTAPGVQVDDKGRRDLSVRYGFFSSFFLSARPVRAPGGQGRRITGKDAAATPREITLPLFPPPLFSSRPLLLARLALLTV